MVRQRTLGVAVAATILVAGANSARGEAIYLDCKASPGRHPIVSTWLIDISAATIRPVSGNFGGTFQNVKVAPTRIEGSDRTEGGSTVLFSLDRISGELRFSFVHGNRVTTETTHCVSLAKPRI